MSGPETSIANRFINGEGAEVIDQRPPFVIRAHHLRHYRLIVMGNDPSWLAKGTRIRIENAWKAALLTENGANSKPAKYGEDVLGNENQADIFETKSRLAYEKLLHLPDDYPAEIVEGIPDVLCNACASGKHCRKLFNNEYHEGESTFDKDVKYMDLFLGLLNLPKPNIVKEPASFLDAPPQRVRRLTTTIGTIKKVMRETPLIIF